MEKNSQLSPISNAAEGKKYHFMVDGQPYHSMASIIGKEEICDIANIPSNKDIYLLTKDNPEGCKLSDDSKVDLTQPGIEKFVTRVREINIFVNSRPYAWTNEQISYAEVVGLAYGKPMDPTKGYTIVYNFGPIQNPKGMMADGQSVFVKHNMQFNVTSTYKS